MNPGIIEKLNQKLESYHEFSSNNIENLLVQTQDFSVFDRATNIGENEQQIEDISDLQLDYDKIAFVLNTASNQKLFDDLLHALWLRIARYQLII